MAQTIRKLGVIGAGQMGNGIAHVCALAGIPVRLNDVTPDRIKAGLATINGNMARQVGKKLISEDARQGALSRIMASPADRSACTANGACTWVKVEMMTRQMLSTVSSGRMP